MKTLSTVRLRLEPLGTAHAEAMFAVLGDPAIYEYENARPASVEALRARYARLESRRSPDGRQQWLNWALRLTTAPDQPLIGYVQATVDEQTAAIAYELGSAWWRQGLAFEAVQAMIGELAAQYGVRRLRAVFKRANHRSLRLLERLQFEPPENAQASTQVVEADEGLMLRMLDTSRP